MEQISYFVLAIISVLGLLCGFIVGWIAKEELKKGKKYFILLQKIIFFIIISFVIYLYRANAIMVCAGILVLFIYLVYFNKIKAWMVYILFGIIYYLSYNAGLFYLINAGIFLYGFPTGSLCFKNKAKLLTCAVVFLIISLVL